MMSPKLATFIRFYQTLAILLLNTVLFVLILNGILYVIYGFVDRSRGLERDSAGSLQYGDERLTLAYPDWAKADRDQLLTETWTRPYSCTPYTHYRERPFQGQYVNVDEAGFRWGINGDQPFPPDENTLTIFVFGGSTTFGYGVADWETIPSYLQTELQAQAPDKTIQVYNFGMGSYYSTLERLLFEDLLLRGIIPDMAIFIDGINEGQTEPVNWRGLQCQDDNLPAQPVLTWADIPMKRLGDSLQYRLGRLGQTASDVTETSDPLTSPSDLSEEKEMAAVQQWLTNRQLIQASATTFEVPVLFVWQPDPRYGYDLAHHIFSEALPDFSLHRYEAMESLRADWSTWEDFLFLADMQVGRSELLYVDALHYNAAFNAEIAAAIAQVIPKD